MADARIPVPDTGGIEGDLRGLARAVQTVLSAPGGAEVTRGLIVGGLASPEIAEVMSQFWAGRLAAISVIVDRATERGQLPVGTDPALLMHAVAAPLYYELLVGRSIFIERTVVSPPPARSTARYRQAWRTGLAVGQAGHEAGGQDRLAGQEAFVGGGADHQGQRAVALAGALA